MSEYHLNALPTGYRLEEYELVRVLGFGGFGITYLGFDHHLDKAVAIKEYFPSELAVRHSDQSVRPQASEFEGDFSWGLARFLDEARTLARFQHPNVIQVYRFFEAHGTGYIVMEYAEGETLSAYLERQGTLSESAVLSMVLPLLDGLAEVHGSNVLHRDIKPSNIMLRDADGSPVLLDFGSARQAIGAKSRSMTSVVTPGYAPIEQYSVRGDQGPWTDIYALGGVCYRALTGRVPEDATERVLDDPLEPVGSLAGAIDWALAVNKDDRPSDVSSWRDALVGEVAVPAVAPAAPAGRRLVVGVVLILGLLGLGGYWGLETWRASPQTAAGERSGTGEPQAVGERERQKPQQVLEPRVEESEDEELEKERARQERQAEEFLEKQRREKILQDRFDVALRKENFAEAERYLDTLHNNYWLPIPKLKELERSLHEARERKQGKTSGTGEPQAVGERERQKPQGQAYEEEPRRAEAVRQRAKEQNISALLAAANQAFQANRLTTPEGDNAWTKYGEVLEHDPNNASAKQGRQQLEETIQRRFDAAVQKEDFTEAERHLDAMRNIYPATTPKLQESEQHLAEVRREAVEQRRRAAEKLEREQRHGKKVPLPGDEEMAFVWIERGEAIGGGFWLGQHEVTQGQWQAVMGETPWSGKANVVSNLSHPAVYISWIDVQAFIRKLNGLAGNELYRLPTEAEWEYACRAGTMSRWSFGDDENKLEKHAWYLNNTCYLGIHREKCHAHAVGEKHPNGWGLYDMHGNVAEFVQGSVARGGSIISPPKFTTSADRDEVTANHNNFYMGVRLLRVRATPP